MAQLDPTAAVAQAQPLNLIQAGRKHWRHFAPAWVFPVVLLSSTYLPRGSAASTAIQWSLRLAFFWVFFRAAGPSLRRELPIAQTAFWAVLVPFAIWVAAVSVNLEMLAICDKVYAK